MLRNISTRLAVVTGASFLAWAGSLWLGELWWNGGDSRSSDVQESTLIVSVVGCWLAFGVAAFFAELGKGLSKSPYIALFALGLRTGGVAFLAIALLFLCRSIDLAPAAIGLLVCYSFIWIVDTCVWLWLLRSVGST